MASRLTTRALAAVGAGSLAYNGVNQLNADQVASLFKAPSLSTLIGSLQATAAPVVQVASAAAVTAQDVQAAALAASLQTVERLLQAQRSGSSMRVALLVAAPVAAGLAIHYFGWQRIGWVTGEQLQEGLRCVREYVGTSVTELGRAIAARFERVDASIAEASEAVQQVGAATVEVRTEVRAVAESLASLEKRMSPIECNSATAAHGVEVLCDLIKTSGLLNNASESSLRRLDTFTGSGSVRPQAPRELEMPPARPELLPPAEVLPPSPPATYPAPVPSTSFLQSLIAAP